MHRALIASVVAAVLLPAVPAGAQVYPERIVVKTKARTVTTHTAYQRRDRDDNRAQETERTTRTFRLGPSGSLTLGNISGNITVTRANGSDTTVEIVKTARGRDAAEARELLGLVTVDIVERTGGRAEVKTRYPNENELRRRSRRGTNVNVDYIVSTPAGTRISADSISGDISVTDVKAEVNASSISGNVRAAGVLNGSAKTISGNVEVADARGDGLLESSSVSGDVLLRRVNTRRVSATSVSGNIRLEDVQCERVSAQTTSANISFSGTLAKNGRYELKGFSGDVVMLLSGNTGFELDATSFSGQIRASDFAISTRGGRASRQSLGGTYGDGSAMLDVSTFSGSITISKVEGRK